MQIIDLRLGAFASGKGEGVLSASIGLAAGYGAVRVNCVHLQPDLRPVGPLRIDRSALGERANGRDHLFVAMTGRGRACGGGREYVPIQAGQAVYFPEAEGYLLFADPPGLTGVLIEGEELSMLSRALQQQSPA